MSQQYQVYVPVVQSSSTERNRDINVTTYYFSSMHNAKKKELLSPDNCGEGYRTFVRTLLT